MSDFKVRMYEEVRKYLDFPETYKVVSVVEDVQTGGYCETCYYEDHVLLVEYVDEKGNSGFKTLYFETIGEFIKALDDA